MDLLLTADEEQHLGITCECGNSESHPEGIVVEDGNTL